MNPNKKLSFAALIAVSLVIEPAFSPRVFAEENRSTAPQWSVQVDKIDAGDVNIEPAFRVAIYENLLDELTKTKEFQQVLRDGDRTANGLHGTLSLEQLQGGTFTITNGGVYGSLMSTPILNMPQSGILGMHKIQDRPMVVNGQIVIRPMMYLALSYDHRIVDGKEAVTFLVRVKEHIEDPQRFLLDI